VGPSSDKLISKSILTKAPSTDEGLNWKSALLACVNNDYEAASSLRAWSEFRKRLNNLCPETEWVFVREDDKRTDDVIFLNQVYVWINSLITNPLWPFPDKIVCSLEGQKSQRLIRLAVISSKKSIPFANPPMELSVAPWKKGESHGWKIFFANTYELKKTGQA
jgi:hypothetical protein